MDESSDQNVSFSFAARVYNKYGLLLEKDIKHIFWLEMIDVLTCNVIISGNIHF